MGGLAINCMSESNIKFYREILSPVDDEDQDFGFMLEYLSLIYSERGSVALSPCSVHYFGK